MNKEGYRETRLRQTNQTGGEIMDTRKPNSEGFNRMARESFEEYKKSPSYAESNEELDKEIDNALKKVFKLGVVIGSVVPTTIFSGVAVYMKYRRRV